MTTARDAVRATLLDAHGHGMILSVIDTAAVLAALGIPPDTTTDTIRAGLALVESFRAIFKWSDGSGPGRNFVKVTYDDATRGWVAYTSGAHGFAWGTSPAAAVNALAAAEERDDA